MLTRQNYDKGFDPSNRLRWFKWLSDLDVMLDAIVRAINNPPAAGGGGGITTQSNVTATRALNTVYQNTSGKVMFITVAAYPSAASILLSLYTDTANPPTTLANQFYAGTNITVTVSGFVLPGSYYEVKSSIGPPTVLSTWMEWT